MLVWVDKATFLISVLQLDFCSLQPLFCSEHAQRSDEEVSYEKNG